LTAGLGLLPNRQLSETGAFSSESMPRTWDGGVESGSREENALNKRDRASVLINHPAVITSRLIPGAGGRRTRFAWGSRIWLRQADCPPQH